MSRKSKAKYKMKGHSIPGIKGCKTTTLEDGRAASSAFQMQSPLHVEGDAYELDDINIKSSDSDANRATAQRAGQTGANYGMEQLIKLGGRLRDKKAAEKMEDQATKYDTDTDVDRQSRQDPNNYDEHGNYKPDMLDIYPEATDVDTDVSTEEFVEAPPAAGEEKAIPNVELKSPPGDPYSYRGTEDGGYEYKKGNGEWTKATGKGLESIKKRYEK